MLAAQRRVQLANSHSPYSHVMFTTGRGGDTAQGKELLFAPSGDPDQVLATLSARYSVVAEAEDVANWTYLDTIDWRLHSAGMTLREAQQGPARELVLSTRSGDRIAAPSRVHSWPQRADNLPPSAVLDRLGDAVGVRALLPMAQVRVRSIPLRLTDDLDKTRVRVRIDQQRLVGSGDQPLPLQVLIAPLRGYDRDGDRCATLLTRTMPQFDSHDPAATIAMTAAGRPPGQPAVPALSLDPDDPAAVSMAAVLSRWIDVVDSVRVGVLEDLDPEYLHDLRTAVRATRSILSLGGDSLLGATVSERFADEFAWLGRLTTPLRDLDVYLLELAGRGAVQVSGLDDLEPLVRHLTRQRASAVRAVRAGLRSDRGARAFGAVAWRAGRTHVCDGARADHPRGGRTARPVGLPSHRQGCRAGDRRHSGRPPAQTAATLQTDALSARQLRLGLRPRAAPRRAVRVETAPRLPRRHPGQRRTTQPTRRHRHDPEQPRRPGGDGVGDGGVA